MSVHRISNAELAAVLLELADTLEIEGRDPFRVRAYREGARTVEGLSRPIDELVRERGDEAMAALDALPGIGERLAAKLIELVTTGRLRQLERARRRVPPELSALLGVPGLGPKRLRLLHERLGVRNLRDLEQALANGEAAALPGFGARSAANLAGGVAQLRRRSGRFLLVEAEPFAEALRGLLAAVPGVERVEVAGSYRRRRETVGDLDLLVAARSSSRVVAAFTGFEAVAEVVAKGTTRAAVRLRNGLAVDLRVVDPSSFGAALHYFTGAKEHVVALRTEARARGIKVSEYGGFRGGRRIAGRTEEEIYALVGAAWIPPELRENRGELEAARAGRLPRLIELGDLCGDLQMHTVATDGRDTIAAMAEAARGLGREYIAFTEHSRAVRVAGGLDNRAMVEQARKIRATKVPGIQLLAGVEVDILRDGTLDLLPETLASLDVVVASVHTSLHLDRDAMTARIVKAVGSGQIDILGHPTGRLLQEREPYEVDLEAVIAACVARGVALEINAHPHRLDLCDADARRAKELGAKLVISTDAHSTAELAYLRYGVDVARRAGLEKGDVLNTFPVEGLLRALPRRRTR